MLDLHCTSASTRDSMTSYSQSTTKSDIFCHGISSGHEINLTEGSVTLKFIGMSTCKLESVKVKNQIFCVKW